MNAKSKIAEMAQLLAFISSIGDTMPARKKSFSGSRRGIKPSLKVSEATLAKREKKRKIKQRISKESRRVNQQKIK